MKQKTNEPTEASLANAPTEPPKRVAKFMGRLDGTCELPEFEPGELVTMRVSGLPPVTFRAIGNRK